MSPVRSRPLPLLLAMLGLACAVQGCGPQETPPAARGRPVPVMTVETSKIRDAVLLTGDIQAEKEVNASFRVAGRVVDRPVNVGDRVVAGQLLAKLDPATEENTLQGAKALQSAARADVSTTRNAYERQQALLIQGFTTRSRYDQAKKALETAQARLDDAEASVEAAADRLLFTRLYADAAGVVTARGAEIGEVVQPGRMVVRIARDDGRDAVFDAPATLLRAGGADVVIKVALVGDPTVTATGRVREVSPEADPVTRTFKVRVGLDAVPETMRLGATVNGSFDLTSSVVVAIPSAALTSSGGSPAVWVVDKGTSRISLRPVEILRFETRQVIVSQGLDPGDVIVAAGVQAVHPGQLITPLTAGETASSGRVSRSAIDSSFAGEPKG